MESITLHPRDPQVSEEYPTGVWLDAKQIPVNARDSVLLMLPNGQEFHAKSFYVYASNVKWKYTFNGPEINKSSGTGMIQEGFIFPIYSFCTLIHQKHAQIEFAVYSMSEEIPDYCDKLSKDNAIWANVNDTMDYSVDGQMVIGHDRHGIPITKPYKGIMDCYRDNSGSFDLSFKVEDWR